MKITQNHKTISQSAHRGIEDSASSNHCSRCGGLLVLTFCIAPDQGAWEYQIPVGRCLQCGDLIDAIILKNRQLSQLQHSIN